MFNLGQSAYLARCLFGALGATLLATTGFAGDRYLMEDGLVVIEIEDNVTNGWTSANSPTGYTGDGFLRWDGPNLFNSPGTSIITYEFEAPSAGNRRLSLRNRHDDPDPTEQNDTWVRMNGGTWFKLFSNLPGTVAVWNWDSRFDLGHGNPQPNASFDLLAGLNTLEFSGRSFGFMMDRVHIYDAGHPGGTDSSLPVSTCITGANYGTATQNSTGDSGEIYALGSSIVSANNLTLRGEDLPTNQFSYLLASQNQGMVMNPAGSQGNLLLGGTILRYNVPALFSGSSGTVEQTVDLTNMPSPATGPVMPGQTWHFQFWYRDANPSATSNFTDGVRVVFQ